MGNNASSNGHQRQHSGSQQDHNKLSAKKSNSSSEGQVRKSTAGNINNHSLDEEFSDLILHQVVKQPPNANANANANANVTSPNSLLPHKSNQTYDHFTNDLIEDEFNEVNDGLVEESTSLARNILPDNNYFDVNKARDIEAEASPSDQMDLDTPYSQTSDDVQEFEYALSQTPTPDLSKVDFTKIGNQVQPSALRQASGWESPQEQPKPQQQQSSSQQSSSQQSSSSQSGQTFPPPARMMSAASLARTPHSASPKPEQQESYFQVNQHNHNQSYLNNHQDFPRQHRNKQFKSNNYQEHLLIPIEIKWVNSNKESINKISIIGSFSNWRDVIKLSPSYNHPNEYVTTINLPLGVHKLLYIINNEYRVSDQLPTATDQEGLFFNWFEVIDDTHLFNHSLNQPNHIGASTDYDANIISNSDVSASASLSHRQQSAHSQTNPPQPQGQAPAPKVAGKYEVEKIQEKSNELLHKITKEASSQFEHVEYYQGNEDFMADDGEAELHDKQVAQQQSQNYPYSHGAAAATTNTATTTTDINTSQQNQFSPYELSKSNSFINAANKKIEYSNEIPEMFINYDYFKLKPADYELPEPPQLPPHLNNVLLNKISNQSSSANSSTNVLPGPPPITSAVHQSGATSNATSPSFTYKRPPLRRADSSYYASNKEAYHLSIPNHVILNHLMTTSIKNDVLTVACITRYSGKFVTQIMHSPADK
ncbi:uncharacterized protein LODBEIA_P13610 [Lodderomyces beijingensis]|uniref:Association with the SNF1 complex (ASC) domain-containing protein n=1 Tax=Lodderomyces beijingensis TaxID=1775926 RepID=A0ABP0ZG48_9ASCO